MAMFYENEFQIHIVKNARKVCENIVKNAEFLRCIHCRE